MGAAAAEAAGGGVACLLRDHSERFGCCVQGNSAYRPELEPNQQSQAWAQLPPEQQQALEAENRALVSELSSLNQSARGIESTMRELAQLSQMFSAQVMHQAEQIEQLYQQVRHPSLFLPGSDKRHIEVSC